MSKVHGRWPSSFAIRDVIELEIEDPYARGGRGCIYKARYNGGSVAVKTMRVFRPQDDIDRGIERLKQVRSHVSLLF